MTDKEWLDLEQEYRAVFSANIPFTMLPADETAAVALIREAIKTRDDSVFEQGIPPDAAI